MATYEEELRAYRQQLAAIRKEIQSLHAEAKTGPFEGLADQMQAQNDLLQSLATSYGESKVNIREMTAEAAKLKREMDQLSVNSHEYLEREQRRNVLIGQVTESLTLQNELQQQLAASTQDAVMLADEYAEVLKRVAAGQRVTTQEMIAAQKAQASLTEQVNAGAGEYDRMVGSVLSLSGPLKSLGILYENGAGGVAGFTDALANGIATGELGRAMVLKYA